jgi:predicted PilT family ATPase
MTTRTHQTLRVGLRRIIRDPKASIRARLQAIRLLMDVEGLSVHAKNKTSPIAKNGATSKKLRELLASMPVQKPQEGLPGAPASAPRQ